MVKEKTTKKTNESVSKQARELAAILQILHRNWMPHKTQRIPLNDIFYKDMQRVFMQCGRKWGKTEILCYIIWRIALSKPKQAIYYFAPYAKQAKELIWSSGRIQSFGHKSLIKKENNSELRLTFVNGSFVKLDGSDNFESHRGTTPDVVIYDEYKDFHPMFHPAMEPNRAAKKATLVVVGTPPDNEAHPIDPDRLHPYYELADEIDIHDDAGAFHHYTAYDNPHIDKDWLDKEKKLYYARGDGPVFEREYMGKRVKGGSGAIIPMFSRDEHLKDHDAIMAEIRPDMRKFEWYVIADPGSATVFAMLFAAVNPYNKRVYILDEIYETDQSMATTSSIIPVFRGKKKDLIPNPRLYGIDWFQVYDEAARWFADEALYTHDENFQPTHKIWDKKEAGLSLIKDQLNRGRVVISSRCKKLPWEVENYVKDKNGKIPKKHDHLIDCWRYLNAAAGFNLHDEKEPIDPDILSGKRSFTPDDDFESVLPDDFI